MAVGVIMCGEVPVAAAAAAVATGGEVDVAVAKPIGLGGVRHLVATLDVTNVSAQETATVALYRQVSGSTEDEEALVEAGGIPKLTALLLGGTQIAQAKSSKILWHLSREPAHRAAIVHAESIPPLIMLLDSEDIKLQRNAAGTLRNLTADGTWQRHIETAGGMEALTRCLSVSNPETRALTCEAFWNMAGDRSSHLAILGANAILELVKLLDSDYEREQLGASGALWAMAAAHAEYGVLIADAGGLPPLIRLTTAFEKPDVQRHSLSALRSMSEDEALARLLITEGILTSLIVILQEGLPPLEEHVAIFLLNLANVQANKTDVGTANDCVASVLHCIANWKLPARVKMIEVLTSLAGKDTNQEILRDLGVLPPLIGLLLDDHESIRVASSAAIYALTEDAGNQLVVGHGGAIPRLVKLATQLKDSSAAFTSACGALMNCALTAENRSIIAQAGGLKAMVKMLGSKHATRQSRVFAAGCILNMTVEETVYKSAVADLGGIPILLTIVSEGSALARHNALGALRNLTLDHDRNKVAIGTSAEAMLQLSQWMSTVDPISCERTLGIFYSNTVRQDCLQQVLRPNRMATLVQLLDENFPALQELAAGIFSNLAADPKGRNETVKAEAIPRLVATCVTGTDLGRERAAACLRSLAAASTQHSQVIVHAKAIQPLVGLLSEGTINAQTHAAATLLNLTHGHDKHNDIILKAGGVPPLVALLESPEMASREFAAAVLWRISTGHKGQNLVLDAGGIPGLVALLQAESQAAQVNGSGALANVSRLPKSKDVVVEVGGVPPLLSLVVLDLPELQHNTITTLLNVSLCHAGRVAIEEAGGIPALVPLLATGRNDTPGLAAGVLHGLANESNENKEAIVDDGAIPILLTLMDAMDHPMQQDYSSAALRSLCSVESALEVLIPLQGVEAIIRLLSEGRTPGSICNAAAMLWKFSERPEYRGVLVEEGAIEALLRVVGGSVGEAQDNAFEALCNLALEQQNHTLIPKAGGIVPCLRLLSSNNVLTQQKAAALIWTLATAASNRGPIVESGGLEPLIALCESPNPDVQASAAGALMTLALKKENKPALVQANAVMPLIELVSDCESDVARANAAGALMNLALKFPKGVMTITAGGAIPPLASLLSSENLDAQSNAAAALLNLALGSPQNKVAMVESGAIPPLVEMLSHHSANAQEHAAAALWNLASSAKNRTAITQAKAIPPLVALLETGGDAARTKAAGALQTLCKNNIDNKIAVAQAGAIPPLVQMLAQGSPLAKETAAGAIQSLATIPANREWIAGEGGLEPLIELLQSNSVVAQRSAAAALGNLAANGEICREVVTGGALTRMVELYLQPEGEAREQACGALQVIATSDGCRHYRAVVSAGGESALQPPS